jgi:Pyruvate/2-oxoacid:ferredoxin oxidoreductase gamma subunit
VRIARGEVLSPDVPAPHALVALNAPSLARFLPAVAPGGVVVFDRTVVPEAPPAGAARLVGVPSSAIARDLGHPVVKNVVALGALHAALGLFPAATVLEALRRGVGRKSRAAAAVNEEAFLRGARAARDALPPAISAG